MAEKMQCGMIIADGRLLCGTREILTEMPSGVTLEEDPLGAGVFVHTASDAERPRPRLVFPLGKVAAWRRFMSCYRRDQFWMIPLAGALGDAVPVETLSLLIEREDGLTVFLLPILDGAFRGSLEESADGQLCLAIDSAGDGETCREVTALFIAVGENPYALVETAARSVMARMQTGRLRREKPLPSFIDLFGWCTWDAFYGEVSHDKVREGLESFRAGDVQPRYLILDDGWQSTADRDTGNVELTSFAPNAKFGGDLTPTVTMAKEEFNIQYFFAWHAVIGYWRGINVRAFPQYQAHIVPRKPTRGMLHYYPDAAVQEFPQMIGLVAPEAIHRFFNDYHRSLARQGVDGVKVDVQAILEDVGYIHGGRVAMMRAYHEALEGSVQTHFLGRLINCMSCANEMIFSALNSTLTRTSTDFMPQEFASHGMHLYTNAQVSLWAGEFVHPDWDMFQSGHPAGAFHAAARAISGCAVYVSDKPEAHDFALLRKLVLSDGSVPRADGIGRPTRDCLFHDPTREDVLLKIFNRNGNSGVVGIFNARYHEEAAAQTEIAGTVGPSDVEGLAGESFAVYLHTAQTLTTCTREDRLPLSLPELSFELCTFVPIVDGYAPIGLTDKFNSAGTIISAGRDTAGHYIVSLCDGGDFLTWCATRPSAVTVNDVAVSCDYDEASHGLSVNMPANGSCVVRMAP